MISNNHCTLKVTAPESSFQIGAVERLHQTLAGMMRAMLLGSSIGSYCWFNALLHAVHLKNGLPHQSLNNKMAPYEAWTNEKPDLSHLRVFGSILCAKKHGGRKAKLDTSLIKRGALLGHAPTSRNAM